jgi:lysyl-tRNA synthetase class 2
MPSPKQWAASSARNKLLAALRARLSARGFVEVETPALVSAPGMEPHIAAFETPFVPEMEGPGPRSLYLHSSPEYAMKRLLADGCGPIFQICKVFRNGEVSRTHNPEFTMLEMYRPRADYQGIMEDLESALAAGQAAFGREGPFGQTPYERLTVRAALLREAGIDLADCSTVDALRRAAEAAGVRVGEASRFEDVFFHVFLQRVEPNLGKQRPTFLIDYPAPMASLSRLKPRDPSVAERFELYVAGSELANGFSELTDAAEQRRRLVDEQAQRRQAGRPVYPLDERFLEAVGRMPPSAGVAVGLDRVLMLLLGVQSIAEVLLFPAEEFA